MNYEERLKRIHTVNDIDKQINLARNYVARLRSKSLRNGLTLDQKLAFLALIKQAEHTFRQLRMNSFDIEDALLAKLN